MTRAPTVLLLLLAPLSAIAAAVGLFRPAIYEGLVPTHYIAESQGQDLVTLFVAAPLLLLSLAWLRQGLLRGYLVALGTSGYVAYVSLIYSYGGVANELYFVYVACLGLSVFAMISLWARVDFVALEREGIEGLPVRLVAVFLLALSALLVLVWGGLGVAAIASGSPAEANTILVTDLAFVIPTFVLAGIWLLRRTPRGAALAGAVLVLNVVLNSSIVAGQVMRVVRSVEPSWGLAALFCSVAILSLALAIPYFARLPRTNS